MSEKDHHSTPYILPFSSDQADLQTAGGKAANLAKLARAGFPVPDGFFITTAAYRLFVQSNQLEERLHALLPEETEIGLEEMERVSEQIRLLFSHGQIPGELVEAILAGYRSMSAPAVAVRSSATAEDLPDLSFAGQQDTYLNVVGEENLLRAVAACWGSLWTARAISYRMRNQVPHSQISLGVVVQRMVQSQSAGVLFSANPLSGLRSVTAIDAALGLGEALVSGQVEPDHYLVDTHKGLIVSKRLGSKTISIHARESGGTQEQRENRSSIQALPDKQILALAELGKQVEALYHFPQDIEWAAVDDALYLLQARPITSLYPLPLRMPAEPLKIMFSFAAVQGIMDPITPIGQDALRWLAATAARLFDSRISYDTQNVFLVAGERLWINITAVFRNAVGRKALPGVFSLVEPTVRQALQQVWDDPRLQPGRKIISLGAIARLLRFFLPLAWNIFNNLAAPRKRRMFIVAQGEQLLQKLESSAQQISGDRWEKLSQRLALFPGLLENDLPRVFLLFVSGVAAGMASWHLMRKTAAGEGTEGADWARQVQDLTLQVTRGMPYNPTTEMDLRLWEIAKVIRSHPPALTAFHKHSIPELSGQYLRGELPEPLMKEVNQFLERYGGRGFGEIDLGRVRWAQDPTHVFEMLSSFLHIEEEDLAPDAVFARGAETAQQAIEELVGIVRQQQFGWLKSRLARFFAGRARNLMGMRENPKFFAVRAMWIVQRELLKSGRELAQAGTLDQAEDVFYLEFSELASIAARQEGDWQGLVRDRREKYQREMRRGQIPRLLLSDGRAFYEGITPDAGEQGSLSGSPVSPGSAEGKVRVVLDPRQANLQPGEILVCPGTDPSWTPLFLSAGGLVMETGGLMTHGAVVAREYGIPAVVGVDRATERLRTGQVIRIDGSSGVIVFIE